jgi:hypothetical protein
VFDIPNAYGDGGRRLRIIWIIETNNSAFNYLLATYLPTYMVRTKYHTALNYPVSPYCYYEVCTSSEKSRVMSTLHGIIAWCRSLGRIYLGTVPEIAPRRVGGLLPYEDEVQMPRGWCGATPAVLPTLAETAETSKCSCRYCTQYSVHTMVIRLGR